MTFGVTIFILGLPPGDSGSICYCGGNTGSGDWMECIIESSMVTEHTYTHTHTPHTHYIYSHSPQNNQQHLDSAPSPSKPVELYKVIYTEVGKARWIRMELGAKLSPRVGDRSRGARGGGCWETCNTGTYPAVRPSSLLSRARQWCLSPGACTQQPPAPVCPFIHPNVQGAPQQGRQVVPSRGSHH